MSDPAVSIKMGEQEKKRFDQRAEKYDMSTAEYIRRRIRLGELIWESNNIDHEKLQQTTRKKADKSYSDSQDSDTPASVGSSIKEAVLRNIPKKNSGDGITDEELHKAVFGTEEEREETIDEAIKQLFGEKIERTHKGLLVRVNNNE